MDMAQAMRDYHVWHEVSGHTPKTIAWYDWMLNTFRTWLEEQGRSTDVAAITIHDARAFLQAEATRTTRHRGRPNERVGQLSDRTIHCYARVIRAFFRWLVAEEYLASNPIAKLKPPKLSKRYKDVLSPEEVATLLNHCDQRTFLGARMYAIVAVLFDCGQRLSELVGLDLQDIQWKQYQIVVYGKGKKERLVPFSPAVHKALRKYLVHRERCADETCQAVFITTKGGRVSANPTSQSLKRLGTQAGIPRLHPHLLRHSAAVAYIMNGGDQFGLKRILGHEEFATTDVYMHYAQHHLAEQHKRFSLMAKVSLSRTQEVN